MAITVSTRRMASFRIRSSTTTCGALRVRITRYFGSRTVQDLARYRWVLPIDSYDSEIRHFIDAAFKRHKMPRQPSKWRRTR
jgi:hypothetical protein